MGPSIGCSSGQADLTDPSDGIQTLAVLQLADLKPHRLLQETTTLFQDYDSRFFTKKTMVYCTWISWIVHWCPINKSHAPKNSVVPAFWLALSGEHSQLWSCLVPPASTAGRYEMTNVKSVLNDKSNPGVARVAHFFKCLLLLHKDWQPLSGGHRRKTILLNEMPQSRNRIVQTKIASTESLLGNHSTRLFLEADAVELEASIPC